MIFLNQIIEKEYVDLGDGKRARLTGYTVDGVDVTENP